jgi:hypothetical protein
MSPSVSEILEKLDVLTDRERHEAEVEILRRTGDIDLPPLTDEALVEIAAMTLRDLDEREAADARP